MRLQHVEQEDETAVSGDIRYDSETLRKVTALAERLQQRHEETLSARDMEMIGKEVGVEPIFVREALRQIAAQPMSVRSAPRSSILANQQLGGALVGTWWAAGWALPFVLLFLFKSWPLFGDTPAGFFMGWAVYVGGGIFLSTLYSEKQKSEQAQTESSPKAPLIDGAAVPLPERMSRQALLETLVALERELENRREHRAFLSIDVVGSTSMKRGETEIAVEYSFGQFLRWVQTEVTAHGGEVQSSAGDGIMCAFQTDRDAVRAARRIQEGIAKFNAECNRLSQPFRVRCGVTAGEVAIDPGAPLGHLNSVVVDRAASLQKRAAPGDIVVSGELAQTALVELGPIGPLQTAEPGETVFSWLAASR